MLKYLIIFVLTYTCKNFNHELDSKSLFFMINKVELAVIDDQFFKTFLGRDLVNVYEKNLDIEFAVAENNEIFILQARPITTNHR